MATDGNRNRPDSYAEWADGATAIKAVPAAAKASLGFLEEELFPAQYANYLLGLYGQYNHYTSAIPKDLIAPGFKTGMKAHWDDTVAPGGEFSLYGEEYPIIA